MNFRVPYKAGSFLTT